MPAIYAHDTFGRIVYKELEGEIHDVIRQYHEYFRIGLQGPDYLFFYQPLQSNPISQIGQDLHGKIATEFFNHARDVVTEQGKHSPYCAYILGVVCHFVLDSEVHGYVEEMVAETGVSHNEIETEFDRSLLLRMRQEPAGFKMGDLISDGEPIARVISTFYEGVTPKQAHTALKTMKKIKNLLRIDGTRKERLIHSLMRTLGKEESFGGIVMGLKPNEACAEINKELFGRYKKAIQPAVVLLYQYYRIIDQLEPLPDRFERDFN